MEILTTDTYTNNYWRLSPGAVGSVGDVNMQVRLSQSGPDVKMRFSKNFSKKKLKYIGSNVQDGYFGSGGSARTIQRKFGIRDAERTDIGWRKKDIVPLDNFREPIFAPLGPHKWRNTTAAVFRAKRTGSKFLPPPGGYSPNLLPPKVLTRGNQYPRPIIEEISVVEKPLK